MAHRRCWAWCWCWCWCSLRNPNGNKHSDVDFQLATAMHPCGRRRAPRKVRSGGGGNAKVNENVNRRPVGASNPRATIARGFDPWPFERRILPSVRCVGSPSCKTPRPGALQSPPALCLPARFSRFAASPSGVAPVAHQNALRASRALTTALNCTARRLQSASSSSTQPVAPSSRAIGPGSSVVSTVKPRVAGPPKHACGATQVIQQFRQ